MIPDCCWAKLENPRTASVGDGYKCDRGHEWLCKDDGRGRYWQRIDDPNLNFGGPAGIPVRQTNFTEIPEQRS